MRERHTKDLLTLLYNSNGREREASRCCLVMMYGRAERDHKFTSKAQIFYNEFPLCLLYVFYNTR